MTGRGGRVAGVAVAAAVAVVLGAGPALADPAPPGGGGGGGGGGLTAEEQALEPLVAQLQQQYQQVETATEKYDGLDERLTAAQKLGARLQQQLTQLKAQVETGRTVAAGLADAQYRNQGVSQLGELILSDNPYQAANLASMLASAARSQGLFLRRLHQQEQQLAATTAQAEAGLAQVRRLTVEARQQKAAVQKQLAASERSLAGLTGAQLSQIKLLEQRQADQAQLAFLATGVLGKGGGNPSALGRQAVSYAFAQLGKPYLWGGNGPKAYDCSGLTQQAWLAAGVQIPRTSQEQWAQLRHVPLNALRPGDLIVYFAHATHVAMYIGDGKVVEAPHTGAYVEVAPIAADPVLGAVRPDPASAGLSSYSLPPQNK
ncbi:C40 family peptidase [Phaeacidiphilus oryzae]|uniref:C40 family peptidase n=1 Tax=Phaeacidiphilus oryzae TaxID=348818 RepID=UPI0007C6E9C4|nr:C40 family peptidase [Phaeacidiphilus oryzae]